MMRALLPLLLLAGCASSESLCQSRGFYPGTEGYMQCTAVQDSLRQQELLAVAAALRQASYDIQAMQPQPATFTQVIVVAR